MNKQELIAKVAKDTGGTKSLAAQAVDSVIDGITRALKKGDSVTFVGFGTFKTSNRKARTARNPQTGAAIKIPKRKAVRFIAGKALKSAVNSAPAVSDCRDPSRISNDARHAQCIAGRSSVRYSRRRVCFSRMAREVRPVLFAP